MSARCANTNRTPRRAARGEAGRRGRGWHPRRRLFPRAPSRVRSIRPSSRRADARDGRCVDGKWLPASRRRNPDHSTTRRVRVARPRSGNDSKDTPANPPRRLRKSRQRQDRHCALAEGRRPFRDPRGASKPKTGQARYAEFAKNKVNYVNARNRTGMCVILTLPRMQRSCWKRRRVWSVGLCGAGSPVSGSAWSPAENFWPFGRSRGARPPRPCSSAPRR